tara:strand:- start:333 stop:599 length:267 start_codon:yes stop_codon:yes gene_type:complete
MSSLNNDYQDQQEDNRQEEEHQKYCAIKELKIHGFTSLKESQFNVERNKAFQKIYETCLTDGVEEYFVWNDINQFDQTLTNLVINNVA